MLLAVARVVHAASRTSLLPPGDALSLSPRPRHLLQVSDALLAVGPAAVRPSLLWQPDQGGVWSHVKYCGNQPLIVQGACMWRKRWRAWGLEGSWLLGGYHATVSTHLFWRDAGATTTMERMSFVARCCHGWR